MSDEVVLYAVGDIAPDRDDPSTIFEHVTETLNLGDVALCQLEAVLSDRGSPLPQARLACRVHTFPHRGDVNVMVEDIRLAKSRADVVIVSMHWGIHFVPAILADYQRDMARAAIDAGADLILGTHAHILKGIEVYGGKAIFFSLCNFALDLRAPPELLARPGHQEINCLNPDWKPDPEYPSYFMPPDSRKTIVVKCIISNRRIKRVSFLPTYIN